MSQDLVFSHEEFYFAAPYTRNKEIPLLLENHSAQPIAFKVKTLDPKRYTVKPTSGVISSGSSISVTITFQGLSSEARVPNFLKSKQKFMVQYRLLEGNADTSQPAAALMAKPEAGGPLQEKKIACRFDADASFKSTTAQEGGTHGNDGGGQNAGQQQSGCCSIPRRCYLYLLVAILVLLLAIGLGYKFREKIPMGVLGKQ